GEFANEEISILPDRLRVYTAEGPFFFGAAESVARALHDAHEEGLILLIRLRHVPYVDATGLQALEDVIVQAQHKDVQVLISEPNARVLRKMGKMGLVDRLGKQNVCARLPEACRRAQEICDA